VEVEMEKTADEVKRLQSCINDLISVLALAAIWSGSESRQMLGTLLDSLLAILRLDFACARLNHSIDGSPIEVVRLAQRQHLSPQSQEVGRALGPWLSGDQTASGLVIPNPAGQGEVAIASFSLGLQDEVGVLLAGSRRANFPTDIELLLLRVAANQAAIGLQEARRAGEQKRVAEALERRVAERTSQLTAVNEELRRSERYLAEAQRLTHTGSWAWRVAGGDALHVSEEWYRIYGFDPEEGMSAWGKRLQRLHPEDRAKWQRAVDRAIGEKSDYEVEVRVLLPGGTVKYIHTVGHPVLNASGDVVQFVGTSMDISASKRAEEAQADLEHVSRVTTMGELTASLAHEVKQPIAAAAINASTCLRWLEGDAPNIEEARAAAMRIVKDAKRAGEIISRIGLLFKKGISERELVDVNEVIREMIVILRSEAMRCSIALRTELSGDLPRVMGDRVQLQQVLMNLMINGIEAMKDVDGTRELAIKSQRADNEQVLVSVSDTGVGLPPHQTDQIFNAFFTTKPHGTGMGLRISRSIIESHGGRLWAADNSPRGASFHLTLPTENAIRRECL
jgi:PAS domain S-box-containing protein